MPMTARQFRRSVITKVLDDHTDSGDACRCGWQGYAGAPWPDAHRRHLADVLTRSTTPPGEDYTFTPEGAYIARGPEA